MDITSLSKPSCASGTDVLNHIKLFVNYINTSSQCNLVNYIELIDASGIYDEECESAVSLKKLSVWSTGLSWYNTMGFKSLTHEEDVKHNLTVINKLAANLLELILPDPVPDELKDLCDANVNETTTIGNFFLALKKNLKSVKPEEKCKYMKTLQSLMKLMPQFWVQGEENITTVLPIDFTMKYNSMFLVYYPPTFDLKVNVFKSPPSTSSSTV